MRKLLLALVPMLVERVLHKEYIAEVVWSACFIT
jgi:hypothetical protein